MAVQTQIAESQWHLGKTRYFSLTTSRETPRRTSRHTQQLQEEPHPHGEVSEYALNCSVNASVSRTQTSRSRLCTACSCGANCPAPSAASCCQNKTPGTQRSFGWLNFTNLPQLWGVPTCSKDAGTFGTLVCLAARLSTQRVYSSLERGTDITGYTALLLGNFSLCSSSFYRYYFLNNNPVESSAQD